MQAWMRNARLAFRVTVVLSARNSRGFSGLRSEQRGRTCDGPSCDEIIELAEEQLRVSKREVERSRVVVRTWVEERDEIAEAALRQEDVTIERVPVGRPVEAAPQVREEDGVLIVPVLEGAAGRHDRAHPQGGDQGHQKEPHGDRP